MVLTRAERQLIQDIVSNAMTYANMVALAAREEHNCTVHKVFGACDLRDSMAESAQFALDDFNTAMQKLLPFTGPKLE